MIKLSTSVYIEAPAHVVWARLAKLEEVELWAEPIIKASCRGERAQGVGAERTCLLAGNITITERWTAWEEGKSYSYEAFGMPIMQHATNHLTVYSQGAQTLLVSEAELQPKWGLFGRLLEPLIRIWVQRLAPNSLAAFKYLVETGEPYSGRHTDLPRPAALC